MSYRVKRFVVVLQAASLLLWGAESVSAKDLTTKYRLYSYNRIVTEYTDYASALKAAKSVPYGHIEEIASKKWLWDNFPRYQVYQNGNPLANGLFDNLDKAEQWARQWSNASIRDLHNVGWVWDNYPRYRIYQGETSLPNWEFRDLDAAKKEAKKWDHAEIIDLSSNAWVWDNIPEPYKTVNRLKDPVYEVQEKGATKDEWHYGYLGDAIQTAIQLGDGIVVDMSNQHVVFDDEPSYDVYSGNSVKSFHNVDSAIADAKTKWHSYIVHNGRKIWLNSKYYQVYANGHWLEEYHDLTNALSLAKKYTDAKVETADGDVLWDNLRRLQFWAWNGESPSDTVKSQVAHTMGLDVDSPTWYKLADASGSLQDKSDAGLAQWLRQQGVSVVPLISNDFDSTMTHGLLSDVTAQQRFISSVVTSAVQAGASGLNLDFESLRSSDRAAFTAFVQRFADAAHRRALTFSIDLPRGDMRWNDKTAFDHEALAPLVDYIVIMAYDEYWSGSDSAGSVSGVPWTKQGIEDFLSYGIPREKLVLGVPFYSRLWKLDSSGRLVSNRALLIKDIPDVLASEKTTKVWDETFQQYKISYREDGYTYVFWMEDSQTMADRLALAKQFDLGGISAWRLGHENGDLWAGMIRSK